MHRSNRPRCVAPPFTSRHRWLFPPLDNLMQKTLFHDPGVHVGFLNLLDFSHIQQLNQLCIFIFTLTIMHFLCLHGVGTNSKVLEMQTAALRYELGDGHTYDFVEGMFPYELAPEIKDFVSEGDQGFSYFDPNSTDASLRAVSDLQRLIVEDGPYDGILAFSQGMMLASTLLVHLQRQKAAGEIAAFPFKCAVFFSPRLGPLDYKELEAGKFVEVDGDAIPEFLSIPTTLI
ncbi:hypothetical protein ASPWEDRAFT_299696 [Aspergillus wentii DTO 134E9]|uniref:Serine hydrolase domain-containing protein n=1 Tax=Aspergillus wentii DTO 134E9 TaxID=1073089 RepID=A0A1L9R4S3_ASPWE|nr:uncharacterized protein ASPWEDRAFT_299696 [Aspergillus wentii DTO 134E9]OJJ29916.1 hypothetical protein ASPWEDRAFT_299696 [Aspergillus wentii DTO 134E9]